MRILFIAMPNSVHTARWINLIADQGWDLHIVSSTGIWDLHPLINQVTNWVDRSYSGVNDIPEGFERLYRYLPKLGRLDILKQYFIKTERKHADRADQIAKVIQEIKPDIIHSMEFQHSSYLTYESKLRYGENFPPWLVTNWGSDIYLFGRLNKHKSMIKQVLENCDYYSCECYRDAELAKKFGLKGEILPVVPNSGGLDFNKIIDFRNEVPSKRKIIAIKGHHWTLHRSQIALRAIEICADLLKDYEVKIYSSYPSEMIEIQVQLIKQNTNLNIEIIPQTVQLSHDEMLKMHGNARISISLSISDGICTALLEAMAMGSFPIQSYTACADEWVEHEKTGFLVHPEDSHEIADAIKRAVSDDELVDSAAERNWDVVKERMDLNRIKEIAIHDYYLRMYNETVARRG